MDFSGQTKEGKKTADLFVEQHKSKIQKPIIAILIIIENLGIFGGIVFTAIIVNQSNTTIASIIAIFGLIWFLSKMFTVWVTVNQRAWVQDNAKLK